MPKTSFAEDTQVFYKEYYGVIRFVCDHYVTVCIRDFPTQKVRDVCMLVYPENYHLISLAKESTK